MFWYMESSGLGLLYDVGSIRQLIFEALQMGFSITEDLRHQVYEASFESCVSREMINSFCHTFREGSILLTICNVIAVS